MGVGVIVKGHTDIHPIPISTFLSLFLSFFTCVLRKLLKSLQHYEIKKCCLSATYCYCLLGECLLLEENQEIQF